jgi:hypothetical protein
MDQLPVERKPSFNNWKGYVQKRAVNIKVSLED